MIERLRYTFFILLLVSFVSCRQKQNKDTYFGGKIINPRSDHVILFYQEKAVDTFQLDEENNFLSKVDIKNEGLFYFKHGPEHQYIYLEPQDSLLIRLNTWYFDESLVFSGKGADRNNMLIDCFIDAEKDEKIFHKLYKLDPTTFRLKTKQLEKQKLKRYDQFLSRHPNETESFKKVLKMAITYPVYSKIEDYPLAKRKNNDQFQMNVADSTFYDYRSNISINKDSIMFFYAYRDYVVSNLYNRVFSEVGDVNSDTFTIRLLDQVNSEIRQTETKNALLRQITIGHFFRRSSCNVNTDAFDKFFKLSSSEEDKRLVNKLLDDVENVHKGKQIAPFQIVDFNNSKHDIRSLVKGKNTVIYFWNPTYLSKEYIASKINYLSTKHPSIQFIGIKIHDGKTDRIKSLDIKNQYFLTSDSDANKFLTSQMPRTILLNKKGVVVNGFASLTSKNIYQQIGDLAKY